MPDHFEEISIKFSNLSIKTGRQRHWTKNYIYSSNSEARYLGANILTYMFYIIQCYNDLKNYWKNAGALYLSWLHECLWWTYIIRQALWEIPLTMSCWKQTIKNNIKTIVEPIIYMKQENEDLSLVAHERNFQQIVDHVLLEIMCAVALHQETGNELRNHANYFVRTMSPKKHHTKIIYILL